MNRADYIAILIMVGMFCLFLGEKIGEKQDRPIIIGLKPATEEKKPKSVE